jgi:tRNA-dihydrouridine synthase B
LKSENLLNIIKEHFEMLIIEKSEYVAIREFRKHLGWYLKNIANASKIRSKINTLTQKKDILEELEEIFRNFK